MNNALDLKNSGDSHNKNSTGKASAQSRESSKKISAILLAGPQTSGYINKKGILVYDNDVLMLFSRVADRRGSCIRRKSSEIRLASSITDGISEGLDDDISRGYGGRIHHIKASIETVKGLFIEGTITHENLKNAHVTDGVVIFTGICFNTKNGTIKLPILCADGFGFDYATVDVNGKIIG